MLLVLVLYLSSIWLQQSHFLDLYAFLVPFPGFCISYIHALCLHVAFHTYHVSNSYLSGFFSIIGLKGSYHI